MDEAALARHVELIGVDNVAAGSPSPAARRYCSIDGTGRLRSVVFASAVIPYMRA